MKIFKKFLILSALCFSFQTCYGATYEWDGSSDIPDDDNIYIVTQTRTISSGTTITVNGTLEIRTGGTITNNGTIENNGTINNENYLYCYSGSTFNNNSGATITNDNSFYCHSGSTFNNNFGATITNNSSFFCFSGSTFNNNSGATITNDGNLFNYTTLIKFNNNGTITNNPGGRLYNQTGAKLNNNSDGTITNDGIFYNSATISNNGTLTNNSGSYLYNQAGATLDNNSDGTITINSGSYLYNQTGATLDNNSGGTITNDGTLYNWTTISNNGTITNNPGSYLYNYTGSTINNNSGGTFSYNGDILFNYSNINNSGGMFEILGGTITNGYSPPSTGTITISSGTFIVNGGSLVKGAGTSNVTIFGANLDGVATIISSGTFTLPSGKTMTIPSGSRLEIGSSGAFTNNETLTNNGTVTVFGILTNNVTYNNNNIFILELGGIFINNGTFNNDPGVFYDFTQLVVTIPAGTTTTIEPGFNYIIADHQRLNIEGRLLNQSGDSIDIYGNVYTYSIIENGDGSNAGTINIHHGGNLFLLGGELENGNGGSKINVNAGGSLYNYHGTIDTNLGDFDINSGGQFGNVRGNYPNTLTINSGGVFLDSNQVQMEKNLDIDYTWTITEKVVVFGNGNEITFGDNGKIVIDGSNASLLLQDVIINDVSGNKVLCTDSNTTLSIDNVVWNMDGDFTFDTGRLYVSGDWLITGTYKFFYETDQVSTITSNATLHLLLSTFDYNAGSNNLINMIDNTSQVHLEYGTLLASQDFTLENGSIFVTSLGTLNGDTELDLQNIDSINIAGSLRRLGSVTI